LQTLPAVTFKKFFDVGRTGFNIWPASLFKKNAYVNTLKHPKKINIINLIFQAFELWFASKKFPSNTIYLISGG
jgi:hypothetical protein